MLKKTRALVAVGMAGMLTMHSAMAWTPAAEVSKVVRLFTYEESQPAVLIQLESGIYCYVPNSAGENKNMINLLLALSISDKRGEFYCYDAVVTIQGVAAHLLHRVSPV